MSFRDPDMNRGYNHQMGSFPYVWDSKRKKLYKIGKEIRELTDACSFYVSIVGRSPALLKGCRKQLKEILQNPLANGAPEEDKILIDQARELVSNSS